MCVVSQVDIGNALTEMTAGMSGGVPQADGELKTEPTMDATYATNNNRTSPPPSLSLEMLSDDGSRLASAEQRLSAHCVGGGQGRWEGAGVHGVAAARG